ncbi:hypothetical protein [Pseudomonas marginalis]|nr:hypothetical protein [Pseudomonas marginalis]
MSLADLADPLQRLAELDTNTVSDALDFLQLPGPVPADRLRLG